MKSRKVRLLLVLLAVSLYSGWSHVSPTHETAVLHIPPNARSMDTYVNLWVVGDSRNLWIRADRPSRLWLADLSDSPVVELTLHGDTQSYRAIVDDSDEARAHVAPLFRAKYGLADRARSVLRSHAVPVRLSHT